MCAPAVRAGASDEGRNGGGPLRADGLSASSRSQAGFIARQRRHRPLLSTARYLDAWDEVRGGRFSLRRLVRACVRAWRYLRCARACLLLCAVRRAQNVGGKNRQISVASSGSLLCNAKITVIQRAKALTRCLSRLPSCELLRIHTPSLCPCLRRGTLDVFSWPMSGDKYVRLR